MTTAKALWASVNAALARTRDKASERGYRALHRPVGVPGTESGSSLPAVREPASLQGDPGRPLGSDEDLEAGGRLEPQTRRRHLELESDDGGTGRRGKLLTRNSPQVAHAHPPAQRRARKETGYLDDDRAHDSQAKRSDESSSPKVVMSWKGKLEPAMRGPAT